MFNGGSRKRTSNASAGGVAGGVASGVEGDNPSATGTLAGDSEMAGASGSLAKYARHQLPHDEHGTPMTMGAPVAAACMPCGLPSPPKLHPAFALPFIPPSRFVLVCNSKMNSVMYI